MIRKVAIRSAGTAPTETSATTRDAVTRAPGAASKRAARAAPGAGVCDFGFFPKAKRLTQPEIQGESARPGQKIDGHDFLARFRIRIKATVRCLIHWRARGKGRALVELGVTEWILRGGDVERTPGAGNQEGTQSERIGQTQKTADENPAAN